MKFAKLDGKRIEPSPKLQAICPFCEQPVIAKCGRVKVWHWAHKSTQHCDHWWEPETQWHRNWKNEFPTDWQEIGRRDENDELHIADVLTSSGLAIEFQHSHINREEVEKRTTFHKNICWIVDGLRLKTSLTQFEKALQEGMKLNSSGANVYELFLVDSRLLRMWAGLNAPVVFDFGGVSIWIIGFSRSHTALVYPMQRDFLLQQLKLGNRPPPIQISQPPKQRVRRLRYGRRRRRF